MSGLSKPDRQRHYPWPRTKLPINWQGAGKLEIFLRRKSWGRQHTFHFLCNFTDVRCNAVSYSFRSHVLALPPLANCACSLQSIPICLCIALQAAKPTSSRCKAPMAKPFWGEIRNLTSNLTSNLMMQVAVSMGFPWQRSLAHLYNFVGICSLAESQQHVLNKTTLATGMF